ncbi:CpsD/CapB family tyrosine-protein kinase [Salipiger aestuarii]|uniref:Mrp family chromosome partitioning ATPase n=1 Tax=Salipiger aestuarii TaxID=568098 RepID=A0A327XRI2_9RHOB|nr:CpsD/CapB family tyrosine-protein kinase [Salipiger aestuarii]EIE49059.1 chromosome partitioning ATPase [Citreicella sp. 357]RAK11678.1 Mrp family chromosome partitioning ATPase [Salipiger aestuarii]
MERIQAAIAKARASRNTSASGVSRRPDPVDTPSSWEALPRHAPDRALMGRMRLVGGASETNKDDFAAFDVLRTRVLKLMRTNGWKRLGITSPTAGCGKSTMALNLGFSMTRREAVSAILIEADLRRPSLATKIGLKQPQDVSKVLHGDADLAANACLLNDRFAISTSDGPRHNSSDLLQSPRCGAALDRIEQIYAPTLMLFDTPPLQVGDDTIGFLQHVDCVILVAAAEHTTIKEIDASEREIAAHANVLGVVLNKCNFPEEKHGYSYYS